MKLILRILCALLCVAIIAGMPFFLAAPMLVQEAQDTYSDEEADEEDEGLELDFGKLFFSSAMAEGFAMEETDEEDPFAEPKGLSIPDSWKLPFDFTAPPMPDPACFTENGYEDESIRVRIETIETHDSRVHVAYVEVADPSQVRTATAYGVKSSRALKMYNIAKQNNVVVAMNADLFIEMPEKKRFEVRMTEKLPKRSKTSQVKDTLMIDKNGDFHLFVLSEGMEQYVKEHGSEIVNAFMFGPALVVDGQINTHKKYDYNRTGHDARSAIGQTGPLSYVMVVVEGRGKSKGVTHEGMAEIMLELGCVQAYNLDGGNTAEMIMIGPDADNVMFHVKGDQTASEYRSQCDIIYFATAVPEEERN